MDGVLFAAIVVGLCFCIGFDAASYNIMRKIEALYKKRNKWFLGYNTYRLWRSFTKADKNGST